MMKSCVLFFVVVLTTACAANDDKHDDRYTATNSGSCEEGRDEDKDEALEVNAWAKSVVGRLTFTNSQTQGSLTAHPGSLLRWSNPIAGKVYGDSFLWLDRGRPAAFLSLYAVYDLPEGSRRLTFQSLSEDSLQARLDETVVWQPREAGVRFQMLDGFPAPGANVRRQRIGHRRIAQLFTGQIAEKSAPDRFRNLRLLTAPLLQYQSPQVGVESGSLYALADGTDPELLLLIETHNDGEQRQWRFAPVRQNHRELRLFRGEVMVWNAPALAPPFPNPRISDPAGIYFNTPWKKLLTAESVGQ